MVAPLGDASRRSDMPVTRLQTAVWRASGGKYAALRVTQNQGFRRVIFWMPIGPGSVHDDGDQGRSRIALRPSDPLAPAGLEHSPRSTHVTAAT